MMYWFLRNDVLAYLPPHSQFAAREFNLDINTVKISFNINTRNRKFVTRLCRRPCPKAFASAGMS